MRNYAEGLPGQRDGRTLREGKTDATWTEEGREAGSKWNAPKPKKN